jgi:hypothetical protein
MRGPEGLTRVHGAMDETEAQFHRVAHYAIGALWALGAVEEALAALYDVLMRVAGPDGLRTALERAEENRR